MEEAKEILTASEAAAAIGISYVRLCRMIRAGKANAQKYGPGITNPWMLHVTEVQRLKKLFEPPKPVSLSPASA